MSEEMPSWRYLSSASSRISSFREYLRGSQVKNPRNSRATPLRTAEAQEDERQSWRAWAGQRIRLRRGASDVAGSSATETINLFPGWAVRRHRKIGSHDLQEAFEVEVFISGFAISHRSAATASRSQRAFIRLAKGFASLPKITADALEPDPDPDPLRRLTPSTEELLAQKKLPPRPSEITEDYEVNILDRHFQRASSHTPNSSRSSSPGSSVPEDPTPEPIARNPVTALPADALRKLHANLESRLQPFWSSVLASRTIRLHLFASPHHLGENRRDSADDRDAVEHGPVAVQDVITAADGSFHARFVVKWEDLCQHPGALHIAFGDRYEEHELLVAAELLPAEDSPSSSSSDLESAPTAQTKQGSLPKTIHIPISHSPIRVVSDIDDTVKLSNVLSGARAVFQNVFVKELQENIIPGMGEWYTSMWSRGIRFHYVSNGPFALLPVLSEFFQVSQLPPGSIKLKSYAGRSIFNGLLSAPALRKRAGVVEILDAFPESRFFLIGDTGEQDMELYSELARERPDQILAVLVRDVDTGEPIDDPTGWKAVGASGSVSNLLKLNGSTDDTPRPRRTLSDLLSTKSTPASTPKASTPFSRNGTANGDYFTRSPLSAEPEPMGMAPANTAQAVSALLNANHDTLKPPSTPQSTGQRLINQPSNASSISRSSTASMSSLLARLPEAEKKRFALQARVYVARTQMPGHVPLRVFRDPGECVEVEEILNKGKQE